ncbi:MAG: RNA-directed DNA polymerase [Cyclobacteriaceae bacterium]
MNLKILLQKGYFPKELPPPFNTDLFAAKSGIVGRKWRSYLASKEVALPGESGKDAERRFYEDYTYKYGSSGYLCFSLPKGIHTRRQLGIPNPKQYHDLCSLAVKNWSELKQVYNKSDFSASNPVEKDATRAVRTKSKTFNEFKFKLIEKSFNRQFELRIDISQFYPTIYTHSIAWAIMGKDPAKKYFRIKNKTKNKAAWTALVSTDILAKQYAFCEQLDTLIRNCQERQSVGFLIGPDISFVLAEIIGNRIDVDLKEKLNTLDYSCIRYYDDYYFYINSYGDAEKILKVFQSVLRTYNLEANEGKIKIKGLPFSFQPRWVSVLASFKFKEVNKHEILNFFSLIFQLVDENQKDSNWIIAHALKRFEYGNNRIPNESWETFLSLLVKTMLTDATNLDLFLKIVLSYKSRLTKSSKSKISELLHSIIKINVNVNHTFEVSWALWILKTLNLKCDNVILSTILNGDDHLPKLICLDLMESKLYKSKKPALTPITLNLNENDLFTDKWLYTYEAIKKGWLTPSSDIIGGHEYFKILADLEIEFYDSTNQVVPEFDSDDYRFLHLK